MPCNQHFSFFITISYVKILTISYFVLFLERIITSVPKITENVLHDIQYENIKNSWKPILCFLVNRLTKKFKMPRNITPITFKSLYNSEI